MSSMDLFQLHALGMASWLSLHTVALAIAPGLTLSSIVKQTRDLTELETFLGRGISFLSLSLAILCITCSGLLTSFLTSNPSPISSSATEKLPSSDTASNPARTPLLVATTTLTSLRTVLYYTPTNRTAFNSAPLWFEMVSAVMLTALGGGLLLFGTGAGSEVKGRSHALFDTPEHREEVKERHRAKKLG